MKILMIVLTAILTILFFTGCQATPEAPVVVQKDMAQMIEKAVGDETSNAGDASEQPDTGDCEAVALAEKLGVPERFTVSLENAMHNVAITADAQIVLPEAGKMPTAKVQLGRIEQETANKLLELLIGDNPFYEVSQTTITKQDVKRQLEILYAMRDGTRPLDIEGPDTQNTIEELNRIIFEWEQRLDTAPDEMTLPSASREYHETEFCEEVIEGLTRIEGESAMLTITPHHAYLNRGEDMFPVSNAEHLLDDVQYADLTVTAQQAKETADAFVVELGLGDMVLDCMYEAARIRLPEENSVEPVGKVYKLQYVRKLGGVPITYTEIDNTASEGEKGQETYGKPWAYERISFLINDSGIKTFEWMSPYTEPEIVTDDTQMKSFDEIASVFENMVLIKNAWRSDSDKFSWTLDVQQVRLGLMRVKAENIADAGLLIPVWDFMGRIAQTEIETGEDIFVQDGDAGVILTVNAIDGSIIDRGLGY